MLDRFHFLSPCWCTTISYRLIYKYPVRNRVFLLSLTMQLLISSLLVLISLSVISADRCGGNCPSNTCKICPCGKNMEDTDIEEWCSKFSEWNQQCCLCIVRRESQGNANAAYYNGPRRGYDVGLWQINQYYNWGSCNNGKAPCDLTANLECAKRVWRAGRNSFRQWATANGCGC